MLADAAEEAFAVLDDVVPLEPVPVAKPVITAVPDVELGELLEVLAALLLLEAGAGQVRLYLGVVEKFSVTANVAASAELESYIVYHQVLVLPNSPHPT